MATYRAISTTETDPEAPVTAALMKALGGNPTAIAEGATGAPRIVIGALMAPTAGAAYTVARLPDISQSGTGETTSGILNVVRSGEIRLSFDAVVSSGGINVHRAGTSDTVVYTVSATGPATVDITITRGQYIYLTASVSGGSGTTSATGIVFSSGSEGGVLA